MMPVDGRDFKQELLAQGRAEGRAEGLVAGRVEGRVEERKNILADMKQYVGNGISEEVFQKFSQQLQPIFPAKA